MMNLLLYTLFLLTPSDKMGKEKFNSVIELIQQSNWDEAEKEINSLRLKFGDDPEYYVLVINYYSQKSRTDGVRLVTERPNKEGKYLTLTGKDSGSTEPVGYIVGSIEYDVDLLSKGISEFKDGLRKFPDRLDMHFGLAYVANEANIPQLLKECLIDVIKISKQNNNKWLWSFDKPYEDDPKSFMLENIQSHISGLFNNENAESDSAIFEISQILIAEYPDNIFGYNNSGAILSINGKYSESNKYFESALNIDPDDTIVMSNMVNNYSKLQDTEKVKYYLNQIIKVGDTKSKNWAKNKLDQLK